MALAIMALTYMHAHACMHAYIHTYTHAYVHTYTHLRTYPRTYARTYVGIVFRGFVIVRLVYVRTYVVVSK